MVERPGDECDMFECKECASKHNRTDQYWYDYFRYCESCNGHKCMPCVQKHGGAAPQYGYDAEYHDMGRMTLITGECPTCVESGS